MKKLVASSAAALSLVGGSFAVAAVSPIGSAGAQDEVPVEQPEDATPGHPVHSGVVSGVLDELVADGTITDAQAETIATRLQEADAELHEERSQARQERRAERLESLAGALGITTDDLAEQLEGGATVADIAGDDIDAVIAALVADAAERIEAAVADGSIDRARADEMLADLEERVTARVNGERPERPGRFGPGRRGFGGPGADVEDATA